MAAANFDPQHLDNKYHFLLRKLHSLTGIVPVGLFLIEHMLTNSRAFHWWGLFQSGPQQFNDGVHFLHSLPFLPFLEIFGIFLPLAFHAIYGVVIWLTGRSNVTAYPHADNWRYTLQRISGIVVFLFVILHLLKFRFAHWIGWGKEFMDHELADKFEITRNGLMAWSPGGEGGAAVAAWITLSIYWIGLTAACFHFANGIWGFCISWGITIGKQAQRRMGVLAAFVGLVLFAWGSLGLYAFATAPGPNGGEADEPSGHHTPHVAVVAHEGG